MRSSEIQAGFAGRVGEGLDAPVVPEPGPVEHDLADPGRPCPLGDDAGPTAAASADLLPLADRMSGSSDEAAASVRPVVSSMTWA